MMEDNIIKALNDGDYERALQSIMEKYGRSLKDTTYAVADYMICYPDFGIWLLNKRKDALLKRQETQD